MSTSRALAAALAASLFIGTALAADGNLSASGSGAVALAGLVGLQDPALKPRTRRVLAALLGGRAGQVERTPPFTVTADAVTCRSSDVDLSFHACELTFKGRRRELSGRAAHELYATLVENDVPGSGAAGSVYESVKGLSCRLDPKLMLGGGGADCRYAADQ